MSRRRDIALAPTNAPRGSEERLRIYRLRQRLGIPLNQPGDTEAIEPVATLHQHDGQTFKTRGGQHKSVHRLQLVQHDRAVPISATTTRDSL